MCKKNQPMLSRLVLLIALLALTLSSAVQLKFIEGMNAEEEDDIAAVELSEDKTNRREEPIHDDDPDLCENIDLGDPFEDYLESDSMVDRGEKSKTKENCLMRKRKDPHMDEATLLKLETEKKEAEEKEFKNKEDFKKMLVKEEVVKEKKRQKEEEARKQKEAELKKKQEEEQRLAKLNYKKNVEEKVKLAEKVKMKAIAEAENAKKEYMEML